jgi:hypothetical protein
LPVWAVGADWAGHGGAESTDMEIDRRHGLIFVYMNMSIFID